MGWIIGGVVIVGVSGVVGMVLDVEEVFKLRAPYWALGVFCGWAGGMMAMFGINQLLTL